MEYYDKSVNYTVKSLGSDSVNGLSDKAYLRNLKTYGENKLSVKKKSFFFNVLNILKEPMLLILIFSFMIAFGTDLGKYVKTGEKNFAECLGILCAIILSVTITLVMEGSSKKAFESLNRIYDSITVKVIRNGKTCVINKDKIVVGDIILLETGDKIVADGRLIESNLLNVDESALTGESGGVEKRSDIELSSNSPLAERKNCVFSGTFVISGEGKMIVTSVGDFAEIGKIASELNHKKDSSPLEDKLSNLGKIITTIGITASIIIFIFSIIKLVIIKKVCFESISELFISSIVLIVAAVPEGLPTIVAVSLALNMIKLSKENALIKKMTAAETAGAVSVICSDKTGTLTMNKMSVTDCYVVNKEEFLLNSLCNSTGELLVKNNAIERKGSGTECAILEYFYKNGKGVLYSEYRDRYPITYRLPFSSENKYMITSILKENSDLFLIKGAPEKIIDKCILSDAEKDRIKKNILLFQRKAGRIICFAHKEKNTFNNELSDLVFDGYVVLKDSIREDAKQAVLDCKRANIKVKMLTGDNIDTAFAIAYELGIAKSENEIVNANDIENLSDENLKKLLPNITVIARSTPMIKLRVVKLLKAMGEVVAVTGDGTNDAPAIKKADIGISMGISGSEITKEASDLILLDDSFSTVIKAVAFGRNVYKNLQRFIIFQLSVNLSALFLIMITTLMGYPSPFNTLQLLWINVIMDGPPAITLGLEKGDSSLMNNSPVKRDDGIVNKKMLLKIAFNGIFIGSILLLQYTSNFLRVEESERAGVTFSLFIFFQLFNAFNSRELGANSILEGIGNNKIMSFTFLLVFIVHLFIVKVCYKPFGISPISAISIIKCLVVAFSIIVVTEIFKFFYRLFKNKNFLFVNGNRIKVKKNK